MQNGVQYSSHDNRQSDVEALLHLLDNVDAASGPTKRKAEAQYSDNHNGEHGSGARANKRQNVSLVVSDHFQVGSRGDLSSSMTGWDGSDASALASLSASLGLPPASSTGHLGDSNAVVPEQSAGLGDFGAFQGLDFASFTTDPATLDFEKLLAQATSTSSSTTHAASQILVESGIDAARDITNPAEPSTSTEVLPSATTVRAPPDETSSMIDPALYDTTSAQNEEAASFTDDALARIDNAVIRSLATTLEAGQASNVGAATKSNNDAGEIIVGTMDHDSTTVQSDTSGPSTRAASPVHKPVPRAPPPVEMSRLTVMTAKEAAAMFNGDANTPFACPWQDCDRPFARKSDFLRHFRTHVGEKPFRCAVEGCDKSFAQATALTVHMRVHSGERPHACPDCDRSFNDSSSLSRHRKMHTGDRPYACERCNGKAFARLATLKRHQKTCGGAGAKRKSRSQSNGPDADAGPSTSDVDRNDVRSGRGSTESGPTLAAGHDRIPSTSGTGFDDDVEIDDFDDDTAEGDITVDVSPRPFAGLHLDARPLPAQLGKGGGRRVLLGVQSEAAGGSTARASGASAEQQAAIALAGAKVASPKVGGGRELAQGI